MKFILFTVALIGLAASSKIESSLNMKLTSGEAPNVFVTFKGGNTKVVAQIENQNFDTRGARAASLKRSLEGQAAVSQLNAQNILQKHSVSFKSFWITNQIFIKGADKHIVNALAELAEVAEISEEILFDKHIPVSRGPVTEGKSQDENEWSLDIIKAPAAWNITKGAGIVVANIDGGVHQNHEALSSRYRNDHSWLDPRDRSDSPWDEDDGHGTHTMGTIAGSHGIGVAPGATWIACKGCGLVSCPQSHLLECGEFMVCPTNPNGSGEDCSKSPNLVSNSWGGGRGSTTYEPMVEAWIAAGIVPLFSQGNSGRTGCNSANSPGDLRRVIGVGATTSDDEIADFSSRGPAVDGRIKPEISGPGANIRSALPGSSNSNYGTMSGTSMSCPNVAGVTALALSINPNLKFGEIRQLLLKAVDTDLKSGRENCGGIPDTQFPNHVFGYGRVNALKAVTLAQATLQN